VEIWYIEGCTEDCGDMHGTPGVVNGGGSISWILFVFGQWDCGVLKE
jgi:hypothetical protein